jgi:hypothetical protein
MTNLGNLVFPVLLLLGGLVLLVIGAGQGQNTWMLTGAALMAITGLILLLIQFGVLGRKAGVAIGALAFVGTIVLAYRNVRAIQEVLEFEAYKRVVDSRVIQGLKDIRTAQLGYRQAHGGFTGELETLRSFLKEGKIPMVRSVGMVPDTLTEQEALELGIIERDTMLVSPLDSLFRTRRALDGRAFPFHPDSFIYAPSGARFLLDAGVVQSSGRNVPVFLAKDPRPLVAGDTLMVGSMEKASTAGNWSGE